MIMKLIQDTLALQLGIDANLIKPQSYIKKDLELDSTESVIIALEIKKRFGVDYKFPAQDVTLESIVQEITAQINEKTPA